MNHTLYQKYVRKHLSPEEQERIKRLRKENLETELLLDLVDSCMTREHSAPPPKQLSLSYDQIEILLFRLLSQNPHKTDAATFLRGLDDPHFFDHVQHILRVGADAEALSIDDMPEIRIQSDEDILRQIKGAMKQPLLSRLLALFPQEQPAWKWIRVPVTVLGVLFFAMLMAPQLFQPPNQLYVKYIDQSPTAIRLQKTSLSVLSGDRSLGKADSLSTEDSLIARYKIAFGDYLQEDYKSAIKKFKALEKEVLALEESEKNNYLKSEFNFYVGLSYLNLAGKRGQHKQELKKAIDYLSASYNLTEPIAPQYKSEVPFFLALAYNMNGDQDQVDKILSSSSIDNRYMTDSEQLKSNQ